MAVHFILLLRQPSDIIYRYYTLKFRVMYRQKMCSERGEGFGIATVRQCAAGKRRKKKVSTLVCFLVHSSSTWSPPFRFTRGVVFAKQDEEGRRPLRNHQRTDLLHHQAGKAATAHVTEQAQVAVEYSPPCTRSQPERFANQQKQLEEFEDRRMSLMIERRRDRMALKNLENLPTE
ncbi:hypothetical protein MRX96_047823 [Rhipicephalus microplus]